MSKRVSCVLLVDDDESTNFINSQLLIRAGFTDHIEVKLNGREALDYLYQSRASPPNEMPFPDVIFLDINMPIMDGWDFLAEYDKFPKEVRDKIMIICMLTTSLHEIDKKKAEESQYISGFLPKPLTLDALNEVLIK